MKEIEFGSPEHIAGLSREALEADLRWMVDRNHELEGICERLDTENAKLRELVRKQVPELCEQNATLFRENAKLRKENDTLTRRIDELCRENEKLMGELAEWERLAAGIELPEYPITQFQPKDLEREIAELRELAEQYAFYKEVEKGVCPDLKAHEEVLRRFAAKLRLAGDE